MHEFIPLACCQCERIDLIFPYGAECPHNMHVRHFTWLLLSAILFIVLIVVKGIVLCACHRFHWISDVVRFLVASLFMVIIHQHYRYEMFAGDVHSGLAKAKKLKSTARRGSACTCWYGMPNGGHKIIRIVFNRYGSPNSTYSRMTRLVRKDDTARTMKWKQMSTRITSNWDFSGSGAISGMCVFNLFFSPRLIVERAKCWYIMSGKHMCKYSMNQATLGRRESHSIGLSSIHCIPIWDADYVDLAVVFHMCIARTCQTHLENRPTEWRLATKANFTTETVMFRHNIPLYSSRVAAAV